MDTTADCYMYAGVRIMRDFWNTTLDHPVAAVLIQLILAAIGAFFFSKRWQLARQRRDFQHQAMVEFAETSGSVIGALWEIIAAKVAGIQDLTPQLTMYVVKLEALLSRDAQLYAVFDSSGDLLQDFFDFTQYLKRVHDWASSPKTTISRSVAREAFGAASARRRVLIGRMASEMRLRPRDHFGRLERELESAVTEPREVAAHATSVRPAMSGTQTVGP